MAGERPGEPIGRVARDEPASGGAARAEGPSAGLGEREAADGASSAARRRAALDALRSLPDGHVRVRYRDRPYGLSVTRHGGGRSTKLYAEALDGGGRCGVDLVSANVYHAAAGDRLLPCEMPEAAVIAFLTGFVRERRADARTTPRTADRPAPTVP